ncbi:carboxypeptidase-like regulatory domain-containing protein [Actinokineospora sp. NBRC 105648]|uniref:carboxypeptidase-like regulatory domain-containing protein n=1 Tax=Actinokineospora sp. NBRC 105648 TaxID=3032206 RepID=UPI0024A0E855|nr:carboxypeptidase-like regulatory domain-containing protein [Actinokineospora sp. NBRC 105648]GLZ36946.1 hypothetical protein Acsp05_05710 [Actinokineospora sp. NBRC 105648]
MSRSALLLRATAGALTLIVTVCAGLSAGPASAHQTEPGQSATTTTPEPSQQKPTTEVTTPPTSVVTKADERPDLRITVAFDKPSYDARDRVVATVTVVNAGPVAATGVRVATKLAKGLSLSWGDLGRSPGVPLAPGERVAATSDAGIETDAQATSLTLSVVVHSAEQDANPADNAATTTAALVIVRGGLTGVLYGDADRDGVRDPGEALALAPVVAYGGKPFEWHEATTDAQGRFAFPDLPVGEYAVFTQSRDWLVVRLTVVVEQGHEVDVVLRGARPVAESLTASLAFAKPNHAVGDLARFTITLTNKGSAPLTGLRGKCTSWEPETISIGALATGVTVPPGATARFEGTVVISHYGFDYGREEVRCEFTIPPEIFGAASARGFTRVPGGVAPLVTASVLQVAENSPRCGPPQRCGPTRPGTPVAGVEVQLLEEGTGRLVTKATTNAAGGAAFADVPADAYDVRLVGPWKIESMYEGTQLSVRTGESGSNGGFHVIYVIPAPVAPAPTPVPTATPPAPAPVAQARSALAETGADVIWLAAGGVLAVLSGAFVLAWHRRRVSGRSTE